MSCTVYMATNRENGKRYIGVTSRGLAARRRQHERAPNNKRVTCRYFHAAMAKYGAKAFDWAPLSQHDTFDEALRSEVLLIAQMRPEYNLTVGGQGTKGHRMTPEGRARWREKVVGRKQSAEHIAKVSASRRGKKLSAETRAKISAAHVGKTMPDEHRKNLSLSHMGQKPSPETAEKRRLAHIGRPLSPEHREKLKASTSAWWAARKATEMANEL